MSGLYIALCLSLGVVAAAILHWAGGGIGRWIQAAWWRFNTTAEGFERFDTALLLTLGALAFLSLAGYVLAVFLIG